MTTDKLLEGHKVTIHLLNGEKLTGQLISFSPRKQRFSLQTDEGDMQYIDMVEIASIGFHKATESGLPAPKPKSTEPYIIHTLTNESFHLLVSDLKAYPNGFFAFPEQNDSVFSHFYFYNQGVRLVEHPKPLGQLMVDSRNLSAEDVKKALATQVGLQNIPLGGILIEQKKIVSGDVDKALCEQKKKKKQIGDILLEARLITEDDLQQALSVQAQNRTLKLGKILIDMGAVSETQVFSALAKKFHLPFVNLDTYPIKQSAIDEVGLHILQQHQSIPIDSDEFTLTVARSDPRDIEGFDDIRFQTRKRIVEVLATPSQIGKLLEYEMNLLSDNDNEFLWIEGGKEEDEEEFEDELTEVIGAEASPIVRLVNNILVHAITKKASDIHILPQAKKLHILFRINGDLIEEEVLEKWVQSKVISRIKLLSGMNIADHRITQDGRMRVFHQGKKVEFRVSCIPNVSGESIVLRVLNKELATDLEMLGLSRLDQNALVTMIKKPFGLILSTGPTGSGKSTTLFSLLRKIIDSPLHVVTIEDPVESEIEGANQIQINAKAGLTFTSVLRNILRHDPDVIMVGEMRDLETASIGIEAALTGHLMLSTLHTNNAVDTITRLHDIGIPNYLLAPALNGIISQNLLKKLCPNCRQPLADKNHEIYAILHDLGLTEPETLYRPQGCDLCNNSGYSGRVMAYEFLIVTDKIRAAIHDNIGGQELQKLAVAEGMVPKAQHALALAEKGIISHEDLMKLFIQ